MILAIVAGATDLRSRPPRGRSTILISVSGKRSIGGPRRSGRLLREFGETPSGAVLVLPVAEVFFKDSARCLRRISAHSSLAKSSGGISSPSTTTSIAAARKRFSVAVGGGGASTCTWRSATAGSGARASDCYARSWVLRFHSRPRFRISIRRKIPCGPLTDLSEGLLDAACRKELCGTK